MLDTQFGVVNSFLDSLGLGRVEWLTQQRLALVSLIIVDTWQWTPFIMLIALAGLTAVPKYLYEAAEIDRASEWFKFRRITFPLVWPLLLIAVMFRAIEAFRLFDLVYILTQGGPGGTTETLSFNVYKVAFFGFDTGRASAYGILMVIVVIDRRAVLPALPQPSPGALGMATHIQGGDLADAGIAGESAAPARPPRAQVQLRDRDRPARAVRDRDALPGRLDARDRAQGRQGHLRRPGQGHHGLDADARELQEGLQRRLPGARRASRTRSGSPAGRRSSRPRSASPRRGPTRASRSRPRRTSCSSSSRPGSCRRSWS